MTIIFVLSSSGEACCPSGMENPLPCAFANLKQLGQAPWWDAQAGAMVGALPMGLGLRERVWLHYSCAGKGAQGRGGPSIKGFAPSWTVLGPAVLLAFTGWDPLLRPPPPAGRIPKHPIQEGGKGEGWGKRDGVGSLKQCSP